MLGDQGITCRFSREIFAKSRLPETAMRRFWSQRDVVINPHGAKFQLLRNTHRSAYILGEHRGSQAKDHVVTQGNGFGFTLERIDRNDRAENFPLDDLGFLACIGDDGWLVMITLLEIFGNTATDQDFGSARSTSAGQASTTSTIFWSVVGFSTDMEQLPMLSTHCPLIQSLYSMTTLSFLFAYFRPDLIHPDSPQY
jgi:hypothetical protein